MYSNVIRIVFIVKVYLMIVIYNTKKTHVVFICFLNLLINIIICID